MMPNFVGFETILYVGFRFMYRFLKVEQDHKSEKRTAENDVFLIRY